MSRSADLLAVIVQLQPAGRHEAADHRRFDVLALAQRLQLVGHFSARHREDHPLLRLADPDLGVRQPLVLERRSFEPDLGADLRPHLADGAAENRRRRSR